MVTLCYQLCLDSEIYTDRFCSSFPTEFMFNFMITIIWVIIRVIIQTLFILWKSQKTSILNWNFYLHTYFTGQLSDCYRIFMSTWIRTFLKPHFFFTLAKSRQLVIKIALYIELFLFLQFFVKQNEISLCSSSSQIYISLRREITALAHHSLFARPTKSAMLRRLQVHLLLSQFAALGETFVGFTLQLQVQCNCTSNLRWL